MDQVSGFDSLHDMAYTMLENIYRETVSGESEDSLTTESGEKVLVGHHEEETEALVVEYEDWIEFRYAGGDGGPVKCLSVDKKHLYDNISEVLNQEGAYDRRGFREALLELELENSMENKEDVQELGTVMDLDGEKLTIYEKTPKGEDMPTLESDNYVDLEKHR